MTDANLRDSDRSTHDFSKNSDVLYKNIILLTAFAQADFTIGR